MPPPKTLTFVCFGKVKSTKRNPLVFVRALTLGALSLIAPLLQPANYSIGQVINSPKLNARELQFF